MARAGSADYYDDDDDDDDDDNEHDGDGHPNLMEHSVDCAVKINYFDLQRNPPANNKTLLLRSRIRGCGRMCIQ